MFVFLYFFKEEEEEEQTSNRLLMPVHVQQYCGVTHTGCYNEEPCDDYDE